MTISRVSVHGCQAIPAKTLQSLVGELKTGIGVEFLPRTTTGKANHNRETPKESANVTIDAIVDDGGSTRAPY